MCWVFVNECGLSLAAVSGGPSLVAVLRLLLLWSMGSRVRGLQYLQHVCSAAEVHRLSCSVACGSFPDQGLNPYPLAWQADS